MCERQEQGSSGRGHGKDAVKGRAAIRARCRMEVTSRRPVEESCRRPPRQHDTVAPERGWGCQSLSSFRKKKKKILKWTATYKDL